MKHVCFVACLLALALFAASHQMRAQEIRRALPANPQQSPAAAVKRDPPASEKAARDGWNAFYSNNLNASFAAFTQAMALDPQNPQAQWGLGVVMGSLALDGNSEERLRQSLRYLEAANARLRDNGTLISDLARSEMLLGQWLTVLLPEGKSHFQRANEYFKKAAALTPNHAPTYANWAVVSYFLGNYADSKRQLERARALGYPSNPNFERALEVKLSESKGRKR